MIFVVDTSSGVCALAVLHESGPVRQDMYLPARSPELTDRMREMATQHELSKVAVATGPGSFTGLRVGVSFGLGLAIGLRIPIVPLATLELQAARSDEHVIAVAEAGRGRLYYLVPGGAHALGAPQEIPRTHPVVGLVSPAIEAALRDAGHQLMTGLEARSFGEAAGKMLESAREVPYGSLRIEYMQSFSARV